VFITISIVLDLFTIGNSSVLEDLCENNAGLLRSSLQRIYAELNGSVSGGQTGLRGIVIAVLGVTEKGTNIVGSPDRFLIHRISSRNPAI